MNPSEVENQAATPSSVRRWIWPVLKWSLFALVLAFVVRRCIDLWQQDGVTLSEVRWDFKWLMLSGCAYAVGWLPSVWFWRKMMQRLGGRVSFASAARGYYCGHLGKYVPGKAGAVVIRAALVKDRGSGAAAAGLAAAYETLVMMAAGAAVATLLSPLLLAEAQPETWPNWICWIAVNPLYSALINSQILAAVVVVVVTGLGLPVISRLLNRVAVLMLQKSSDFKTQESLSIDKGLLAAGLAAFVVGWAIHGLSLGLTIRAVSGEPLNLSEWPIWMGAVSGATVIGFVVLFAPGGIGPREGVLIEVLRLQPSINAQTAVAAAIFLRAVWFLTEILVAAILYYTVRHRTPDAGPH